jgi:hypothetical protein
MKLNSLVLKATTLAFLVSGCSGGSDSDYAFLANGGTIPQNEIRRFSTQKVLPIEQCVSPLEGGVDCISPKTINVGIPAALDYASSPAIAYDLGNGPSSALIVIEPTSVDCEGSGKLYKFFIPAIKFDGPHGTDAVRRFSLNLIGISKQNNIRVHFNDGDKISCEEGFTGTGLAVFNVGESNLR